MIIYKIEWYEELIEMRERILGVRRDLIKTTKGDLRLAAVSRQKGIFSLLPLDSNEVDRLARERAIYTPSSGRINIAGFKTGDVDRFDTALQTR